MKNTDSVPVHRATKVERAEAREAAAKAARRASYELGLEQKDIAPALAVNPSHISRVESRTDAKLYTLADLRMLMENGHEELAAELLRWVLEESSSYTRGAREKADTKTVLALVREGAKESQDVTDAALGAIEDDGEIDAAEARKIIKEAEEDIASRRRLIGTLRPIAAGRGR